MMNCLLPSKALLRPYGYTDTAISERSQKENIVPISHGKLANELGTTRVVVSRILKQFEHEKKIRISR